MQGGGEPIYEFILPDECIKEANEAIDQWMALDIRGPEITNVKARQTEWNLQMPKTVEFTCLCCKMISNLVYGTGDTVDFISAWVNPGDPDPTTSLGSWLKNAGQEYQNDNVLVLSEDLQDMTFADLFKGEFWTSKFSRLLPYTLSFLVPYTAGARIGGALLGRYGLRAMKYAN